MADLGRGRVGLMDYGQPTGLSGNAKQSGWKWFGAWAIVGALGAFAVLSAMTVGLLILPVAVFGAWVIASRARAWPELLGLAPGAGVLCLTIAYGAQRLPDCSEPRPPARPLLEVGDSREYTCGDADSLPWLVAGAVFVGSGIVGYAVSRPRVPE